MGAATLDDLSTVPLRFLEIQLAESVSTIECGGTTYAVGSQVRIASIIIAPGTANAEPDHQGQQPASSSPRYGGRRRHGKRNTWPAMANAPARF